MTERYENLESWKSQLQQHILSAQSNDNTLQLTHEVATLKTQLSELRKYVKIWVKREQSARHKAAVKIQTRYRGYSIRKTLSPILHPHFRYPDELRAYSSLERIACSSHVYQQLGSIAPITSAVITIQKLMRGYLVRTRINLFIVEKTAATMIQACWRGYVTQNYYLRLKYCGHQGSSEVCIRMLCRQLHRLDQMAKRADHACTVHEEALRILWEEVASFRQAQS